MSVASIIDQATGKIYDDLIPQGGGIPLTKGQLISANAAGTEVPVPVGANGTIRKKIIKKDQIIYQEQINHQVV